MKFYHVDAFADQVFEGNLASVCVMDSWPDDAFMQKIARENNLPETVFAVKDPAAKQRSARNGTLYCEDEGDRVLIAGRAVLCSENTLHRAG
ncbi:MAG: PhzF family phenazine biosynthesis protein [Synergistaceae bacterium]|jgi:predicted PhzF superfamily epimerase YddE/YHI9|nr:PhzF family phenazine biosynthesis protein [Synergistaceae bacterium]